MDRLREYLEQMRPHIVWFHEMPFFMERIEHVLRRCTLFISIGTSGVAYPAAGFVDIAKASGAFTLEVNIVESGGSFDDHLIGPATEALPALEKLLEDRT